MQDDDTRSNSRHLLGPSCSKAKPGVHIFRIADGKIVERWGRLDDLGLLQQLGLSPQPA